VPPARIRPAEAERDAAPCAAIYSRYVHESAVSFEEVAPSDREMAGRIERIGATHPWLVAEHDRGVVGFAYASRHRERAAYRWAVDVTVYVDPAHHRRGIGRRLYEALLALLRERGFHVACAGIALPNDASVRLHEALGFEPVGVYRDIGYKAGAWHDVGWWQIRLVPPDGPPAEPA
jgi:L-amino acid N-acyltransferase YncA